MKAEDWINVKDALPEYNTQCLVMTIWGFCYVALYLPIANSDKGCFYNGLERVYAPPAYWMPIVPPKED